MVDGFRHLVLLGVVKVDLKNGQIRKLTSIEELKQNGFDFRSEYESTEIFRPYKVENEAEVVIGMKREKLSSLFKKELVTNIDIDLAWYGEILEKGLSWAFVVDDSVIGFIIIDKYEWNNSLHIVHIEVKPEFRDLGVGKRLLEKAYYQGIDEEVRIISVETQSTNVRAMDFYRRNGYIVDSIDVSLYSNNDLETGDVAVFMKRRIAVALNSDLGF